MNNAGRHLPSQARIAVLLLLSLICGACSTTGNRPHGNTALRSTLVAGSAAETLDAVTGERQGLALLPALDAETVPVGQRDVDSPTSPSHDLGSDSHQQEALDPRWAAFADAQAPVSDGRIDFVGLDAGLPAGDSTSAAPLTVPAEDEGKSVGFEAGWSTEAPFGLAPPGLRSRIALLWEDTGTDRSRTVLDGLGLCFEFVAEF